MVRFGIIAEGVTDQIVLEAILAGYFEDDDLDPTPLQPPAALASPAVGNAGWGMVLKHFETRRFADALDSGLVDYIVVQIDTDVSEQKGYDVSWREAGRELTVTELIERVIARLRRAAGEAVFDKHRERLIFAVSVHAIECWLLPLLCSNNKRKKTTGCLEAANKALRASDRATLSTSAGAKDRHAYLAVARAFDEHSVLLDASSHNESFAAFIAALDEHRHRSQRP